MKLPYQDMNTPVGKIRLIGSPEGTGSSEETLVSLEFSDCWERVRSSFEARFPDARLVRSDSMRAVVDLMNAYFEGDAHALDRIAADPSGTPFQASVWRALREIPAGTTTSYKELGRRIGSPRATRAVGTANGSNPIAIVIPCHRVIRSDGLLGGYGGGLHRKEWLLGHEGAELGPW